MKKNKLYIFILLLITGLNTSCNYLDIVPDETATEKDAFANPRAALRYLYSCYGYLPQSNMVSSCMDFTADETISPFGESYGKFAEGAYDASNTIISYWNTLFSGIRQCYLLKDNINSVPGISKDEVDLYTAEADFLIAYFHFILIRSYGPTVLVKELPSLDTPAANMLGRRPYDECIDWVADLFDDVATRLPATRNTSDYGRATSVIAKSLKARMLLYAASPLFNGNPDYADFKNPDGEQLMPTAYSEEKYKRAADAALEAIQAAEAAGHVLYKATSVGSTYPEPADLTQRSLRMTFMDSENYKEVIFPETRKGGTFSIQRKSIPWCPRGSWNGVAPTITMIDRFYTKNGLPIDEDPEFEISKKLDIVTIPAGTTYAEPNKQTLYMHMNREPRFYAWIAFENGYYECRTGVDEKYAYHPKWNAKRSDGDKWLTGFMLNENCGAGEYDQDVSKVATNVRSNNFSKTGYLNKKGVHPGIQASVEQIAPTVEYPWPVIRLAELYLNYAEACVGYGKDGYPEKGMAYLDRVRERAGLPTVLDSWKNARHPLTSYSGQCGPDGKVMQIVIQERMIELYQENHNFWDLRRWKMAEEYLNVSVRGLNITATTLQEFARITEVQDMRSFQAPRQYLMPIPAGEVSKNPNMVQNPGY